MNARFRLAAVAIAHADSGARAGELDEDERSVGARLGFAMATPCDRPVDIHREQTLEPARTPIDFRAAFTLPSGARHLHKVDAAMIAGRLTVWFEWSGGLWYTFDDGAGKFTPLRVIKREAGGFTADAIVLVRELIDRLPPVTP